MGMRKAEKYISADAIHVSPKAIPIPTRTALFNLTKGGIVAEGEKLGIELDMELTKTQMVTKLMTDAKKNAMAVINDNDPKAILNSYVDSFTTNIKND